MVRDSMMVRNWMVVRNSKIQEPNILRRRPALLDDLRLTLTLALALLGLKVRFKDTLPLRISTQKKKGKRPKEGKEAGMAHLLAARVAPRLLAVPDDLAVNEDILDALSPPRFECRQF